MIAPDDLLVAAAATTLRRPPPRVRPLTRREAHRLILRAIDAWPRVRDLLFANVRQFAI